MNGVRIYKDNFRTNSLFALFLSDTSPIIMISIAIAVMVIVIFLFLFHIYNLPFYILTIGGLDIAFITFSIGKKDNEMKFKAIPRHAKYLFSKKQHDTKQLDSTLSDFKITGNYIERKKTLIAMYEIFPSDTTLLSDEALTQFYHHIKMAIHNLPAGVMFIAKKKVCKARDYNDHFYHLYKHADEKRQDLIKQYQEELSAFIDENSFKKLSYYAVFSTPLPSRSEKHFAKAAKQLFDMGNRFVSSLLPANIAAKQFDQEELSAYCKSQLQTL